MTNTTIRAGIVGGGGYTAGELIRILLQHPRVDIAFVQSKSQAGKPLHTVHEDLIGDCDLLFSEAIDTGADVLFLCMGHGQSRTFLAEQALPAGTVVIDLSHDFRLDPGWVYGLPELNGARTRGHRRIANPGCFATAIQLGLLPLAAAGLLTDEVHVHAVTGSTGAGQSPQPTTHFSWRHANLSVYKAFQHQHLAEIGRSLRQLQPAFDRAVNFVPLRGDFARGIFASLYTRCDLDEADAVSLYEDYYRDAPFTVLSPGNPHLKQVVNTNKCLLHLERHDDKLLVLSAIDNLTKGASGQAVQNMNIAFGWPETTGLKLKAPAF